MWIEDVFMEILTLHLDRGVMEPPTELVTAQNIDLRMSLDFASHLQ